MVTCIAVLFSLQNRRYNTMKNGLDATDCWIVDGVGLLCRFPMCGRVLSPTRWAVLGRVSGREMNSSVSMVHIISVELETNLRKVLLRAFSWLKAAATAFTSIKTQC